MKAEGSLGAPLRRNIDWRDAEYYDEQALNHELERVFDICHGCRRCFNLCDSFPRLFDMVDESPTGELDSVPKEKYGEVVEACTLCDLCFMVKCPYVPPHEFDLDFPHLMLRYRAVESKKNEKSIKEKISMVLCETDINGKIGNALSPIVNWVSDKENKACRSLLCSCAGVAKDVELPKYASKPLTQYALPAPNPNGPAFGQEAVIYTNCHPNYAEVEIGLAAAFILAKQGVKCHYHYPECCGMPQLEQGEIARVAGKAGRIARSFSPYIAKGMKVICLTPSCALMVKNEWRLIEPNDEKVVELSQNAMDISEYIVYLSKIFGLESSMTPIDGEISVHIACHSRSQNIGNKGAEILQLLPNASVKAVERCSGHGGSWGVMKDNFPIAKKMAKPTVKQLRQDGKAKLVASECPLAAKHIRQMINEEQNVAGENPQVFSHPLLIMAQSYGYQPQI